MVDDSELNACLAKLGFPAERPSGGKTIQIHAAAANAETGCIAYVQSSVYADHSPFDVSLHIREPSGAESRFALKHYDTTYFDDVIHLFWSSTFAFAVYQGDGPFYLMRASVGGVPEFVDIGHLWIIRRNAVYYSTFAKGDVSSVLIPCLTTQPSISQEAACEIQAVPESPYG